MKIHLHSQCNMVPITLQWHEVVRKLILSYHKSTSTALSTLALPTATVSVFFGTIRVHFTDVHQILCLSFSGTNPPKFVLQTMVVVCMTTEPFPIYSEILMTTTVTMFIAYSQKYCNKHT